ncbi:RAMP superfamily CRISPR-associated protein [Micromonospora sp. WMMA1976]|uniref:RAMP superfamily CRISPR-associated protein n=1 Tax=Micromonospora sp. WMMA1976 TaxID=3014995 RepID=UPI00248A9F39|nr:RAMP superfamily CRISPR-associated protein [Micromonospora sp. WMMA1976]WBC05331.1 RAMP superfamily CRISPR-associated protein [Micromonospora sp. WMMA1976]
MGQSIGIRTEVLGTLTCLGPVHVGGWDTTPEANLTVALDGTGRPCLPGTSIAGALRAYLAGVDPFRDRPVELMNALFGHIATTGRGGTPSWIRVDDAHLIGDDVALAVRDGVGIDRRSASAAANFLYTRQVLPAGTRFALRLIADTPMTAAGPDHPGGWPALVGDAVNAMIAGLTHARVPIGAGRGRGFGRVELRDVTFRRADLSQPAGLISWLTGSAPTTTPEPQADVSPPDGRLRITVAWRPAGPLLVRDSISGTVVDTLPLTETAADGTVRLLLPGSSVRGAVRAHAERIVRTLQGRDAPERFQTALRQPPPGVDVLFGSAPTGRRASRPDAPDQLSTAETGKSSPGRRGALTVADCHSVGKISAESWNEILSVSPDPVPVTPGKDREERQLRNTERDRARSALRNKLDGISSAVALGVSDHVAIDRWTGGAGDHRLFSVLDPASTVAWEPVRIDVDTAWLGRDGDDGSPTLALPLLLLLLRDLRDGWLSLGYGGTRGRGQIEVTGVAFDGDGLSGPWRALAGQTLDSILADPPQEVIDAMARWEHTFQEVAA